MMGFLMPFIVLIERRLLRPVMLALLSSLVLIVGLGAQAGASGKPRKLARDLEEAVASPVEPGHRWVQHKGGQRLVEALIVSDATNGDMTNLREHVLRLGGTAVSVPVNHRPRLHGRSKYGMWNRLGVGIVDLWGVSWLIQRRLNPSGSEEI